MVTMYSSWETFILLRYRINKAPNLGLICMTGKKTLFFSTSKQIEHANNSRGDSKQSLAFRNSKAIEEDYI